MRCDLNEKHDLDLSVRNCALGALVRDSCAHVGGGKVKCAGGLPSLKVLSTKFDKLHWLSLEDQHASYFALGELDEYFANSGYSPYMSVPSWIDSKPRNHIGIEPQVQPGMSAQEEWGSCSDKANSETEAETADFEPALAQIEHCSLLLLTNGCQTLKDDTQSV